MSSAFDDDGGSDAPVQPLVTSERILFVPREELEKAVMCSICRHIPQLTVVSKDCMHRFCDACVERIMRQNNTSSNARQSSCPLCRCVWKTKRHVVRDPAFDELMFAIFGDVEAFNARESEEDQEEEMRRLMQAAKAQKRDFNAKAKEHAAEALGKPAPRSRVAKEDGVEGGATAGTKRPRSESSTPMSRHASAPVTSVSEDDLLEHDVVVLLCRHPGEFMLPELDCTALRMKGCVTLQQLHMYVATRMLECELEKGNPLRERLKLDGTGVALSLAKPNEPYSVQRRLEDGKMTMARIYAKEWERPDAPLILLYHLDPAFARKKERTVTVTSAAPSAVVAAAVTTTVSATTIADAAPKPSPAGRGGRAGAKASKAAVSRR